MNLEQFEKQATYYLGVITHRGYCQHGGFVANRDKENNRLSFILQSRPYVKHEISWPDMGTSLNDHIDTFLNKQDASIGPVGTIYKRGQK